MANQSEQLSSCSLPALLPIQWHSNNIEVLSRVHANRTDIKIQCKWLKYNPKATSRLRVCITCLRWERKPISDRKVKHTRPSALNKVGVIELGYTMPNVKRIKTMVYHEWICINKVSDAPVLWNVHKLNDDNLTWHTYVYIILSLEYTFFCVTMRLSPNITD